MKKFVIGSLLASAVSGFVVAGTPIPVAAAETHQPCAQFDNSGNIVPGSLVTNCSFTLSYLGGEPQSMPGENPCTQDPGTITIYTTHTIFHINVNGDGDLWVTGTSSGSATFTSSDGGPNGSGPWSSWFGGSVNNRNAAFTDTFNLVIKDTAGDTIGMHEVDHMTLTATGVVHSFSYPTLTCG